MNNFSKKVVSNELLIDKLLFTFNNNDLPNSIIFYGDKGIGKTTLSLKLLNEIFSNFSTNSSILNSENLIYKFTHPNIKYITKEYDEKTDKFKNFITIDQIKNLENFVFQSTINDLPKFIIVDSADDLNNNSANSILKMLEEPKKNTFFILIAHKLSNLLPTIRSRCVKYYIEKPNLIQFKEIINSHQINYDEDTINFLYSFSNASPGIAIEIDFDKLENLQSNIVDFLLNYKSDSNQSLINLSNNVEKFNNDEFKIFLMLFRFILLIFMKNNLGTVQDFLSSKLLSYIINSSKNLNNITLLNILDYINKNEKDLYTFNLDKKIFCLNIFSATKMYYE